MRERSSITCRQGLARQAADPEQHCHSERPEGVSCELAAGSRFDSESRGRGCRRRVVCRGRDLDAEREAAEEMTDMDLSSKTLSRGGN